MSITSTNDVGTQKRRPLRRTLVPILVAAAVLGVGVAADGQPAAAAAPGVTITCEARSNTIVAEVGPNHLYYLYLERWNGRDWVFKGESGWQYLTAEFTEDGWGNRLTNGYYRMNGVS